MCCFFRLQRERMPSMNSNTDLWNEILKLLSKDLPDTSINA